MKNRLILVEGIPGSGKSTIAYKIKEYLESQGIKAKLYSEGDAHPADLAWNACLTIDEYTHILNSNPELKEKIKENTKIEGDYAIIAYTKLGLPMKGSELTKYFESKEVYDGRATLETFKKLHFQRWEQFAKSMEKDKSVAIFECAYLQNHVNELMGCHEKSSEYIEGYMFELIETVKCLNPKLIYLTQPDVEETIKRVAAERVTQDKSKWDDWIDLVIRYVEGSKYGQSKGFKGYEGTIEFFKDRKKIEENIIAKLSIDKAVINNSDYNWDMVFDKVIEELDINN
ncbi:thymidylate kinase [Oceanirhabdus sp. W0125-5]|uniref:thymidylate kinase n=1 Tax=Oceanirhabdus sp. W0125-5 TaxID=2999116 RepID=UPI0022F2CB7B|nr:thymidylate kinase [Oceanirhabdus sp. W0125-5]WBW97056.1 thymidylate kinase [Oceanirhabdus sp. W0125-5]